MNIIASVLAGQGVARILDLFGASNVLSVIVAAATAGLVSIGLFIWKKGA